MNRLQALAQRRLALQLESERERGAIRQQFPGLTLGLGLALSGFLAARRWGPQLGSIGAFLLAGLSAWKLARNLRGPRPRDP